MGTKYILLTIALFGTKLSFAQNQDIDRKEIDSLVHRFYNAISFDNSKGADNEALQSVHYDEAMVGMVDTARIQVFKEREFQSKNDEVFSKNNVISFQEKELNHITHVYGGVAVRFSIYEFKIRLVDKERTVTGVNTIQLIKDPKKGWLIYSTFFSDNLSYPDIPSLYLPD